MATTQNPVGTHYGKRVLVAEDNQEIATLAVLALSREGLSVDHALDGLVAVEMFAAAYASGKPYNLLLVDLAMPYKDGFSVIEEVRAIAGKSFPVLIMTADVDMYVQMHARRIGVDGVVGKPFDVSELYSTVCASLDQAADTAAASTSP